MTIPSQIRYVHYYGDLLKRLEDLKRANPNNSTLRINTHIYSEKTMFLKKIVIHTIPRISGGACGTATRSTRARAHTDTRSRRSPYAVWLCAPLRGVSDWLWHRSTVLRHSDQEEQDVQVQGCHRTVAPGPFLRGPRGGGGGALARHATPSASWPQDVTKASKFIEVMATGFQPVAGDVKIEVYHKDALGKVRRTVSERGRRERRACPTERAASCAIGARPPPPAPRDASR